MRRDDPQPDRVPESTKYIEEQFAGLPPDVVHKITCENAARFYGPATKTRLPAIAPPLWRSGDGRCDRPPLRGYDLSAIFTIVFLVRQVAADPKK